jgi:diguanylate cyclase (GGDEF)-like protein
MALRKGPSETPQRKSPQRQGGLVLLLSTADADLGRAWQKAEAPPGFRLETAPDLRPEHLASSDYLLVLADAEAVLVAEGPLAQAFQVCAGRCVWTGPAAAIERLGAPRIAQAYDILVTPVGPAALGRRLAGWARNIQRTAALEAVGQRAEQLAVENNRLAARAADAEAKARDMARQRERLDQALRRIHQVARLSREINLLDVDRIIAACIERLPALVEAKRASLYLYDPAADRLILQGHSSGYPVAERVDLKENARSPMAMAVRTGELLLIREFQEFERSADVSLVREYKDHYATTSCIIVPLKGGGRVRGVLNLADKEDGASFDQEIDLPVVEQIAELIGASIYNVELYQEMERRAKTDPLTNLANRRGVEEALARETDRSRRYGSHLTVLMLDVDQLKDINDTIGHSAGDAVLTNLAAILLETVRSVDVPGRWAGDEFLVVLPDTSAAQAEQLARRLQKRARERPARASGKPLVTSVSIGVAEYLKDETLESLIHRVDQAMYAAKHGGRDRIAVAVRAYPPPGAGPGVEGIR